FIGLHALTIAFLDLDVDAQRVARIERGDGLALGDAGDFFFLKRIDQVHQRDLRGAGSAAPSSRKPESGAYKGTARRCRGGSGLLQRRNRLAAGEGEQIAVGFADAKHRVAAGAAELEGELMPAG